MGQYLFRLPDIGEGVAEAEIVAWHVKVGDHIKEDQPLLDVVTDKATVDMSSPVEGTVTALHGEVGARRRWDRCWWNWTWRAARRTQPAKPNRLKPNRM